MKKMLIVGLLSLGAAGAYAQGTVNFAINAGGHVSHIWSPSTVTPTVQTTGQTSTDSPTGVATYPNSVLIGGSSGTEPASALSAPYTGINYSYGNNFTAQIYAWYTINTPISSLVPVTAYVTTLTTSGGAANAGFIVVNNLSPDPGIPNPNAYNDALNNGLLDNSATIALAVWYNAGGTITSLAAAKADGVPYGESAAFNQTGLGEPSSILTAYYGVNTASTTPATMSRIQSFDLIVNAVPEPSTIALGVLGGLAFLARRRQK